MQQVCEGCRKLLLQQLSIGDLFDLPTTAKADCRNQILWHPYFSYSASVGDPG